MTAHGIDGLHMVVVGAASGIGQAVALRLGAGGASLACLDVNDEGCAATAAAIRQAGGEAFSVPVDVRDEASVERAFAELDQRWTQLHALVNCVGITGLTAVRSHDLDVAELDAVYAVNLRGAFLLSRAAIRRMLPHHYGRICHLASIAGKEGNAGMTAYSATKAGLIGMVKVQGKECAETGITVNALAPAVIETPLVQAMPEEQVKYMTERIPMGRCGTLSEVAELVTWIVSPACSFTTGFTFDLTGGRAVY